MHAPTRPRRQPARAQQLLLAVCACADALAARSAADRPERPSHPPSSRADSSLVARDDAASATAGAGPVHVAVLGNDAGAPLPACLASRRAAPATSGLPLSFADVTARAGLRARPQRALRTSPNCVMPQWDARSRVWDAGSFCVPELFTGGAAAGDLDGDGLVDLYLTRLDSADGLFLNEGDGSFVDASAASNVAALTARARSNGVALADVDNDGDLDVYLSTLGDSRFYLLINDGAGHFAEDARARGLAQARDARLPPGEGRMTSSFSIAVGDYDGDGWLDLYTTEWFPRLHQEPARSWSLGGDAATRARELGLDLRGAGGAAAVEEVLARLADRDSTAKLLHNRGSESAGLAGVFEDAGWAAGLRAKPAGTARLERDEEVDHAFSWLEARSQAYARAKLEALNLTRAEVERHILRVNADAAESAERLKREKHERARVRGEWHARIAARAVPAQGATPAPAQGIASASEFVPAPAPPPVPAPALIDNSLHQWRRAAQLNPDPAHLSGVAHVMAFDYVGVFQFGAAFADLDGDGRQELLVSGDFGTSKLYWNAGNGTFLSGFFHPFFDLTGNAMGATIGDVDGNGRPDVLLTSVDWNAAQSSAANRFYPRAGLSVNFDGNRLYLGEAAGRSNRSVFIDAAAAAGVKRSSWAWGGVLFDYDNDGTLDLVVSNGLDDPETTDDDFAAHTPNAAFRGRRAAGAITFEPVGARLGLDDRRDGRGYLELDFDSDGDLDLLLVNSADFPALYRNDGGDSNSWLRVKALEPGCAHEAACAQPRESLGATVTVIAAHGDAGVTRQLISAAAFMAQSEMTAHFGLGGAGAAGGEGGAGGWGGETTVHSVTVAWPSVPIYSMHPINLVYLPTLPSWRAPSQTRRTRPTRGWRGGCRDLR